MLIDPVWNAFGSFWIHAVLAQLVERTHGKGEVAGSIPADGTIRPMHTVASTAKPAHDTRKATL